MTDLQRDKDLLLHVARVTADAVLALLQPGFDELSKREAEQLHGRRWLDYHIKAGNISPRRKGHAANSKAVFSRTELNALWEAESALAKNIIKK